MNRVDLEECVGYLPLDGNVPQAEFGSVVVARNAVKIKERELCLLGAWPEREYQRTHPSVLPETPGSEHRD